MDLSVSSAATSRRRRTIALTALSAVAALALAGCASGGADDASGSDTLTLVAAAAPTSINPALANADTVGGWYSQLPYDPLIRLTPEGTLEPDLAVSWQFLDDQSKEFELTLREDVMFSDGTEMTAEAVADSINYFVEEGVNGAAWLGGADTVAEATGENTVVMHLGESNSTLPFRLTQRSITGSVIAPAGLENPEALKNQSFGAGPYVLDTEQTVPDNRYVYTANENYWNPDDVHYDEVVIQVSGSNSASFQALEAGDADIMRGDLATATSAEAAGLTVASTPASIYGVGFVDREGSVIPELADVRVRQALAYAIDRESIVQAAWGDAGIAGNALTPPDLAGYSDEVSETYAYDPEKAKELLAEAGYADGLSFTIGAWNLAPADAATQAVVQNWADIGVQATIEFYSDPGQMATDVLAGKFGIVTYYYGAVQTGATMSDFVSGAATQYNPFGTTDPQIEAALNSALTSPDEAVQAAAYEEAMSVAMVDDVWLTNIAYAPSFIIMSDRVTGTEFGTALSAPDMAHLVRPAGD